MPDIFKRNPHTDPDNPAKSGPLNIKPVLEDTPDDVVTKDGRDKFPNFIHQGSLFNAAVSHEVHRPSPLILPIAVGAAVIWIICIMAMYFGFFGPVGAGGGKLTVAQGVSLFMLAFIPAILIGVIAYALQQLSAMSAAATQLTRAAKALAQPDDAIINKAQTMSQAISSELEKIKSGFDATMGQISNLETAMRTERESLDTTSIAVKKRFETIGAALLDQHKALDGLADIFDARMESLSETLSGHARDLEDSTQLAEQKLQEARVSLDGDQEKLLGELSTLYDDRMSALSETLTGHARDLEEKSQLTEQKLQEARISMNGGKDKLLDDLAGLFDERMMKLSETLSGHARDLEEKSQLAEQKLHEARISLDGALGELSGTAERIREGSIDATSSLTRSETSIDELGQKLHERSVDLSETYTAHSKELSGVMEALREEQDNLAASLDERLAKMRDMSLSAQRGAESLKSASEAGRETVEALAEAANIADNAVKQRFAEMEDMVRYSNDRAESISDTASRRVQDSLAHTRKEILRIETDMAALQDKLNNPEVELVRARPKPQRKPKRRPLAIQPVEDDVPPLELVEPRPTPAPPEIEAVDPVFDEFEDDNTFDLDIQPIDEPSDLRIPDPDEDLKSIASETVQRAAPVPILRSRKPADKSRWGWRDMLTGLQPDTEIKAEPEPEVAHRPAPIEPMTQEQIIVALSHLGLTPGAIVDDGCIIEACNARKANGDLAMSQVVAKRLGDPVRHLYIKMEENPDFKSNAHAFTVQYKIGIDAIENDREAIRIRLESDAGRAFLLCDAALNG